MISKAKRYSWSVCGLLVIALMVGCQSQPEVTSPEAMVLIKKFYTAANSKNEQRLADSEADLKELVDAQKLSDAERQAFKEIADLARSGDWDTAQKRALSFAEAQVR
jgi:hypothetical protein